MDAEKFQQAKRVAKHRKLTMIGCPVCRGAGARRTGLAGPRGSDVENPCGDCKGYGNVWYPEDMPRTEGECNYQDVYELLGEAVV